VQDPSGNGLPERPGAGAASVWANRSAASVDVVARAPVLVERLDVTLRTMPPVPKARAPGGRAEGSMPIDAGQESM
jgi:hypothetical protein